MEAPFAIWVCFMLLGSLECVCEINDFLFPPSMRPAKRASGHQPLRAQDRSSVGLLIRASGHQPRSQSSGTQFNTTQAEAGGFCFGQSIQSDSNLIKEHFQMMHVIIENLFAMGALVSGP